VREHQARRGPHDDVVDHARAVHQHAHLTARFPRGVREGSYEFGGGDAVGGDSAAIDALEGAEGTGSESGGVSVDVGHRVVPSKGAKSAGRGRAAGAERRGRGEGRHRARGHGAARWRSDPAPIPLRSRDDPLGTTALAGDGACPRGAPVGNRAPMAQLTPLAAADAARLLADYGLSLAEWRPLDAGSVNSNFTFTTPEGQRYFARIYEEQGAAGAETEFSLLEALARQGVPVALPRPLVDGRRVHEFQGKPFAVYPFVEGEILCQKRVEVAACAAVGDA